MINRLEAIASRLRAAQAAEERLGTEMLKYDMDTVRKLDAISCEVRDHAAEDIEYLLDVIERAKAALGDYQCASCRDKTGQPCYTYRACDFLRSLETEGSDG